MYDVIIIGAGIAGAAVAHQCALQGLSVMVLERTSQIASGASGNPAGILYPYMASNYDAMTAFYLHGLAHSISLLQSLDVVAQFHSLCGMLHLPKNSHELSQLQGLSAKLGLPPAIMQPHDQGFFMPASGWVNVPAFCAAMLTHQHISCHFDTQVMAIEHDNQRWQISSATGECFAAEHLVIANAYEAEQLLPHHTLPMRRIRGQITYLPAAMLQMELTHVLCYGGYLTPAINNVHYLGATFEKERMDLEVDTAGHQYNINMLPQGVAPHLRGSGRNKVHSAAVDAWGAEDLATLKGRAAFRTVSGDRFPIIGAVYDAQKLHAQLGYIKYSKSSAAELQTPYLPNLYVSLAHGARGLTTAPLAGAFIADKIAGAKFEMLNQHSQQLLSTPRFALRAWRKNIH